MNRSSLKLWHLLLLTGIFAIAMGILEAIVVIYLRDNYYPQGFDFPLVFLSPQMLTIEWIREAATIIMLMAVGILAGKNNLQRFLFFLFTFAVWDIAYYLGLKWLIGWPASLFTWDVLFLIPLPWISPVLAPVICSLTMILFSVILFIPEERGYAIKIKNIEWVLLVTGSLIILYSFMQDYGHLIFNPGYSSGPVQQSSGENLWPAITQYIPDYYNWYAFSSGEVLILVALFLTFRRIKKEGAGSEQTD